MGVAGDETQCHICRWEYAEEYCYLCGQPLCRYCKTMHTPWDTDEYDVWACPTCDKREATKKYHEIGSEYAVFRADHKWYPAIKHVRADGSADLLVIYRRKSGARVAFDLPSQAVDFCYRWDTGKARKGSYRVEASFEGIS